MLGVAWLDVTGPAVADPLFPYIFRDQLHTPCAPDCTLCHNNDEGGYGNRRPGSIINTWIANYALDPKDPQSLVAAFMGAEADKLDTDHDSIHDTEELLSGSDPDDPTQGAKYKCREESPAYGCVRIARRAPVDDVRVLASACAAAVGVAALRRRIARSRRATS
jgi:hypothetical protein